MSEVSNDLAGKELPPPVPITFTLDGSAFTYELKGEWDEKCGSEQLKNVDPAGIEQFAMLPAEVIKNVMGMGIDAMVGGPDNRAYDGRQAPVETVEIDGTALGSDNTALKILVHRPSTPPAGSRRGIIYAHGGAAVAGSAAQYRSLMARYAVDYDAVVCSVDYRLAPEHKAPKGIMDMVAAVRYVSANADKLGIDAARVAVAGESGGAYIVVGAVCELLRQGHGGLVKLCLPIIPMNVSDFFRRVPANAMKANSVPRAMRPLQLALDAHLTPDPPCDDKYIYVAPEDAIVDQFPPTAVMTTEFDFYRDCAQEFAARLHKHGKLVEWCVHPGVSHAWYFDFGHPTSGMFWADQGAILDRFL